MNIFTYSKDVRLPKSLQRAMAAEAESAREARAKVQALRPQHNGCHFQIIFFIEKCCIWNKMPLKYVLEGPIDNKSPLMQIMAWRRPGDKPLPDPMLPRF